MTGQFSRRLRGAEGERAPLPLPPGPVSNGEFVPLPMSPRDRALDQLIRNKIDETARRLRMDRRGFLRGAGAVAASLAAIELAGCSSPRSAAPTSFPRAPHGGTYAVPPATDKQACEAALGGNGEFIFDVHTHYATPGGPWVHNAMPTLRA